MPDLVGPRRFDVNGWIYREATAQEFLNATNNPNSFPAIHMIDGVPCVFERHISWATPKNVVE